jgi:hypothetical protein
MPAREDRSADRDLVARCLAGDQPAWEELYSRARECAQRVLSSANKALRDEISSDRALDPYLRYLLRREQKHYYQDLARRRRQLARLARKKAQRPEELFLPEEMLEELEKRLTPAEKRYWQWRQLPEPKGAPPFPLSRSYARQLEHRIWQKARRIVYGQ